MEKISLWHFILGLHSGGVEKVIEMYTSNIDTSRYDLHIVTHMKNQPEQKEHFKKMGFTVHELHSVHGYKIGRQNLREYKELFSKNHMDIVHNHQPNNMLPLYYAKKYGVKVRILHSHNNYRTNISQKSMLKQKLYRIGLKINVNNATDLFSCGKCAAASTFGEEKVAAGKVHIISNAIYPEKFGYRPEIRAEMRERLRLGDALTLCHIGRYEDRQKNQEFVLRVFKDLLPHCPDARLLMIGSGPRLDEFQTMASDMQIDRQVNFVGIVDNVQDYLQAADIFVFPSRYEGLGIVMIEAQATGLFCIASKNVPEDAGVSEKVVFLDTTETSEWVETILAHRNDTRTDQLDLIDQAGYNIHMQAGKLDEIYKALVEMASEEAAK